MRADLHVHSNASDGTLSPSELVALAIARDVSLLAIADHDSVEGLTEAKNAAKGTTLSLIPAVELSSVTEDGRDVHILGYFINPSNPSFLAMLQDLRSARYRRAEAMVATLSSGGFPVSLQDVLAFSNDGSVGRSHIARALVSAGHAETVAEAFNRFIGRDRPYYVSKDVRTPLEAITCIRDAGGLAVIAHPGITGADDLLADLVRAGLAGIEAYHAEHTPEQQERYAVQARVLRVLATGGSDFHGPDAPNAPMGSVDIPERDIAALIEAGGQL